MDMAYIRGLLQYVINWFYRTMKTFEAKTKRTQQKLEQQLQIFVEVHWLMELREKNTWKVVLFKDSTIKIFARNWKSKSDCQLI